MGGAGGGFFCQAEDGIRDLVRSRGLGDVYKRQPSTKGAPVGIETLPAVVTTRIASSTTDPEE